MSIATSKVIKLILIKSTKLRPTERIRLLQYIIWWTNLWVRKINLILTDILLCYYLLVHTPNHTLKTKQKGYELNQMYEKRR